MALLSLPNEILFLISDQCDSVRDVCRLMKTCRALYHILKPSLYHKDSQNGDSLALGVSVFYRNIDSLRLAIKYGAYTADDSAVSSALSIACSLGYSNSVELILEHFPLVPFKMPLSPPLKFNPKIIGLLLAATASRESHPCFIHRTTYLAREALWSACSIGCQTTATMILDMHPRLQLDYVFERAYQTRNVSMIRFLMETAVTLGKRVFFPTMATSKDPNIISLLDKAPGEIRRTKDESELIHACFTGNTSTVKRLCEIGTAVDMETARGTPPLFHAIRRGYTGIVRELLKHGAPVSPGYPNHRYYDAVTTAVDCRHVKILRVLLDAEVPYNQELALLCTIHNKDIDSMVLLHPDPNMRYTNGRTALHLAARYGFLEGVAILAGTGASLSQDDAGMTPMDYAREQGHNNTLALLESLFL